MIINKYPIKGLTGLVFCITSLILLHVIPYNKTYIWLCFLLGMTSICYHSAKAFNEYGLASYKMKTTCLHVDCMCITALCGWFIICVLHDIYNHTLIPLSIVLIITCIATYFYPNIRLLVYGLCLCLVLKTCKCYLGVYWVLTLQVIAAWCYCVRGTSYFDGVLLWHTVQSLYVLQGGININSLVASI
uniref:Uncharacterized protein n=1 Tax=Megaviridae environmental sample TaxID=1737588 RepID=A0A5J6VIV6_9VIRU|nr:MAG: hypothetical protein [Megaviridae environmental sample]